MHPASSVVEYIPFTAPLTLSCLLARPGLSFISNSQPDIRLRGVCNGRYPVADTLCFVDREPSIAQRHALQSVAVLTSPALAVGLECLTMLVTDDPRAAFIDLVNALLEDGQFHPFSSFGSAPAGIDASAFVHPHAILESDVVVGPGCQVAAGCVLKRGTVLMQDVVIRENTVLGCEGIGRYVTQDARVLRFPHLAGVFVGIGVEIGANCVIARGALTSTVIGAGSIIGNLCNIGHGVQLGEKTWMSVGCLIGGNTHIGHRATLGLGVNVRDNLQLGEGASIAMGSTVMRSVEAGTSVMGNPAKVVPGVTAGPER